MTSIDLVVVGSCNMDLISYVPRLPVPGETLHGSKFSMGFGGKGANQCVMAARLGAGTVMIAKVGDDMFGKNYIQNLQENEINIDHVSRTAEASTGVAPIAVNDKGENSIIIVSGANLLLSSQDVHSAENVIKNASLLICQLEVAMDTTLEAMKIAKSHNVTTVLNPAPAQSLPDDLYKNCDVIVPNETEAEILTGIKVTSVEDSQKAIECLLGRGCTTVIITLGHQGSVYATQGSRKIVHVPADEVVAMDTTGAGDAFVGALGYFMTYHKHLDLREQIRRAGRIATQSVLSLGTQTSYPYRKDIPEKLFN